jgi:hypothetical protein
MSTVEELIKGAADLNDRELDQFVLRALELRAQRHNPGISADEETVLLQISQGPGEGVWEDYHRLIGKRDARTLTPEEHTELLRLTDVVEDFQTKRLQGLSRLAQLRGTSLETVMQDLGIRRR